MDFDNLKELRQRNVIDEKSYITRIVDFAKLFLEKNMKLEVQKIVEKGCYGGKIIAKEAGSPINLAAKVIIAEKCPKQYTEIWPSLKHPNIHRLLDMQYLSRVDAHVFVTEHHSDTLQKYLESSIILENRDAPVKIKGLLWGILEGLEYLHERGYSHLALKDKNILISSGDKAVISNFSALDTAKLVPNSTLLPLNYGPPELHFQAEGNLDLFGSLYDIWSFGILALNIFTKGYLHKKISEDADWQKEVYPTLQKVLQVCKFSKCIKKAFPKATLNRESKKLKMNFIMTCLRILPADRPSPHMLLRHGYFNPDGGFITVYKQPWGHLQADDWIEMLNRPSTSSNEYATLEIFKKSKVNSAKFSKENRENDKSLQYQDIKLSKSLKGKDESVKDTTENLDRLSKEQNSRKETEKSVLDKPVKYRTENESNNNAQMQHHVRSTNTFGIFKIFNRCGTKEATKEGEVLHSKREKNELVNESTASGDVSDPSRDSQPMTPSKVNMQKSAKDTAQNPENERNRGHLTNSQNESPEIKKSSTMTEDSAMCYTSNISENGLQIHDINDKKTSAVRNTEVALGSGLAISSQKKVNDSTETPNVEEFNACSISIKSNNPREIPRGNTKKIEIIRKCELTLDIDVTTSSQKELDDKIDIVGDQKSRLESKSFDDYSVKIKMNFIQPEFNEIEGALKLTEKEKHSPFSKQKCPLFQSKLKLDSGDNFTQKILIEDDHSGPLTNISSKRIVQDEDYNEYRRNEEEFHAKQCHKKVEETDSKVLHNVEYSSRSLSAVENASEENGSQFVNDCHGENHTFNSMKSESTNLTKDNISSVYISENGLNLLQDKESISVSSSEIETSFSNASDQVDGSPNAEVNARKISEVFDATSSSSFEYEEEIWESESYLELGLFDVRVHGDVVSTNLNPQQDKAGNCGDDSAI